MPILAVTPPDSSLRNSKRCPEPVELSEPRATIAQTDSRLGPSIRKATPVVAHSDAELAAFSIDDDVNTAAFTARTHAVADEILDERLQDEPRHERVANGRIYIRREPETGTETGLLDRN